MFLKLLIEVILIAIIMGGATYGYRKGFFALAIKPVKAALCLGTAVFLCVPFSNWLLFPLVTSVVEGRYSGPFTEVIATVLSTAIAFLTILLSSGIFLSLLSSVVDSCVKAGIIGRINSLVGFLLTTFLAVIGGWIFVSLSDWILALDVFEGSRLVEEFEGGLIYSFFKTTSPFDL